MTRAADTRSRVTAVLRQVARHLRHLPDRLLHGVRRRRALGSVRRAPAGSRVLIVCHGNICRSPYAAVSLSHVLARGGAHSIPVDSAGFIGPGRRPPANARTVARRRGLDLDGHVSKLVTPGTIGAAGIIVVMDDHQRRAIQTRFQPQGCVVLLGDCDPEPIRTRAILDPINQSETVFESVYSRIDRCVGALSAGLGVPPESAVAGS